jgi:hypothetical protein
MKLKKSYTPSGKVKIVNENGFSICNMTSNVAKENEENANYFIALSEHYSELLKQRNELLNVLEMCAQDFCNGNIQNNPSSETRIKVFDVLNNFTNA